VAGQDLAPLLSAQVRQVGQVVHRSAHSHNSGLLLELRFGFGSEFGFSKEISRRTEQLLFDPPSTRAEIDSLSNNCTKIIQDSHHVSAFEKEIFLKRDPIFLPKEIMSLIRGKRMLNKHLQREYDFLKKKEFNFLSREIKNKIIEHKQKRWQNFCDSLNDFSVSDSKLWNKIRSVDSSNPTSRASPKLLINGNHSDASRIVQKVLESFRWF
jgi:hypothetical protein